MTMGERIKFFRKRKGMTQRQLGLAVGFDENTAIKRIGQYETGVRSPKKEMRENLAKALDVHPAALAAPDVSVPTVLLHTLFALEDEYGLHPAFDQWHEQVYLCTDKNSPKQTTLSPYLEEMLTVWLNMAEKVDLGEITKEEYDRWRYRWPCE